MARLVGYRCSLCFILWSLVGFGLIIFFLSVKHQEDSGQTRLYFSRLPSTRELEEVEEEHFRLPPPHKVNPRAVKRRGPRKQPKVIENYLDESSAVHALFFPCSSACTFIPVECGWTLMANPFKLMVVGLCMISRLLDFIGMEKTKMDRPTKLTPKEHIGLTSLG